MSHPIALVFGILVLVLCAAALAYPHAWPARKLSGKPRPRKAIVPWAAGGTIFGLGYVAFGLHRIGVYALGLPIVAASFAFLAYERVSRR